GRGGGGGTQEKRTDGARQKRGPAAGREPVQAPAAKPGTAGRIESGLASIQKLRKQALEAGQRIDSGLEKVERGLSAGIRAGKKVDSGLEKIAELAERVTAILGADSPLGGPPRRPDAAPPTRSRAWRRRVKGSWKRASRSSSGDSRPCGDAARRKPSRGRSSA